MNLIVVLDDRNGMSFHRRRQSRDRVLTNRILQVCGKKLIVHPYTAELFEGTGAELTISEDPLSVAKQGDWCFLEIGLSDAYAGKIERLVVYRWNCAYPFDLQFDLDLSLMKLVSKLDFQGYSHQKLTEEVYLP